MAVAGADIRHLHGLAQKALIQPETDERYAIHELLRQFARNKLVETDEYAVVKEKHALFFADFMAERDHDIRNKRQIEALKIIDPDFENVRSAWQYVVSQQEWDHVPKFLHSLWFYLDLRARGQGGFELLDPSVKLLRSVPLTPTTELTLGRVLVRLGWFVNDLGRRELSTAMCEEGLRILRQYDSWEDILWTLQLLILQVLIQNDSDVMAELAQQGLAIARSIGNENWEGIFLEWLGSAHLSSDMTLALQLAGEGVAILEPFADHYGVMTGLHTISQIKERQQDYEQAAYWNERLWHETQLLGHIFLNARCFVAHGRICLAQKDYAGARPSLLKGLQLYWDAGYSWVAAFPLVYIVQLLAEQNELERAVEIRAAIDAHLVGFEQSDVVAQALYDQLKAQMDPDRFAAAWSRGMKRDLGTVVYELLADLNGG